MNKFLFFLGIAMVGYFGLRMGEGNFVFDIKQKISSKTDVYPELEFPCTKNYSFTFVVYASNQALWCERSLKSIFMQDYESYRVIVIDDASTDDTYETINKYILSIAQDERVLLMRNETRLGFCASLYRAIENCQDREIVIPLEAKDWLVEEGVLTRLNAAFQNPDVWMTRSQSLLYPTFTVESKGGLMAFYAALFKQVPLEDFFSNAACLFAKEICFFSMETLSNGRVKFFSDPLVFSNEAGFGSERKSFSKQAFCTSCQPLVQFPHTEIHSDLADFLIFSEDRPIALYALLESIERYISGFSQISVMYWGSDEQSEKRYQELQSAFPKVQWFCQSAKKRDFKSFLLKTLTDSPAKYILFAVDDLIVKDFVDLTSCMHLMQRTNAYGFYLQLGANITHCFKMNQDQMIPPAFSIGQNAFAWDYRTGKNDWNSPNTLNMTLYRKTDIQRALKRLQYTHFDELESIWSQHFPEHAIGLFFEKSKIVSLPLKLTYFTDAQSVNSITIEEMLAKWDEGLKMDINPLFQIDNVSCCIDYIPDFIQR